MGVLPILKPYFFSLKAQPFQTGLYACLKGFVYVKIIRYIDN